MLRQCCFFPVSTLLSAPLQDGTVMQMVPVNSLLDSPELRVQVDEKGVEFIVAHTEQLSEQSVDGQLTSVTATIPRSRRRAQQTGSESPSSHKRVSGGLCQ